MRAGRPAAGAVAEGGRPAGDGEGAQEVGVEDESGIVFAPRERREPPGEQRELLTRRLLGLAHALGGLEHRDGVRPRAVVAGDVAAVGGEHLDLGHRVERTPFVELGVDDHPRLEARPEAALRPSDPLRRRPDQPAIAGEERDDAVGLTELLGAQHDRGVSVEGHAAIVLPRTDNPRLPHPRRVSGEGSRRSSPWTMPNRPTYTSEGRHLSWTGIGERPPTGPARGLCRIRSPMPLKDDTSAGPA